MHLPEDKKRSGVPVVETSGLAAARHLARQHLRQVSASASTHKTRLPMAQQGRMRMKSFPLPSLKEVSIPSSTGKESKDAKETKEEKQAWMHFLQHQGAHYDETKMLDTVRAQDFPLLDQQDHVYLDYTGGCLVPLSLLRQHHELLSNTLLGNPHSKNPSSLASSEWEDPLCCGSLTLRPESTASCSRAAPLMH